MTDSLTTRPHHQPYPALKPFSHNRVIPVIRALSAKDAQWGAEQLVAAGFRILEITWTTPDAHLVIQTLRQKYPEVSIGAGTVLSTRHINQALEAGAQWMVSPIYSQELLEYAKTTAPQIALIPGVSTPSEVYQAHSNGALAIKLFPIQPLGGVPYFRSIQEPLSPLSPIHFIPTGGVALNQISDYLNAGALAVGLGSQLISPAMLQQRDAATLQERAKTALLTQNEGVSSQ